MLPLIVALAGLVTHGIGHSDPLLTVTRAETATARWAETPSEDEVATMPASRVEGGARAALDCVANADGSLGDCTITQAQPDRAEVRQSAFRLIPRYRLERQAAERAAASATPARLWLVIEFPDGHGDIPQGCELAFGCALDAPIRTTLPPPQTPTVER